MYWISQLGSTEIKKRLKSRHCPKGGGGLESAAQIEWSTFFVHWNGKKRGGVCESWTCPNFLEHFLSKNKKNIFEEKILHFEKNAPLMPKLEGGVAKIRAMPEFKPLFYFSAPLLNHLTREITPISLAGKLDFLA